MDFRPISPRYRDDPPVRRSSRIAAEFSSRERAPLAPGVAPSLQSPVSGSAPRCPVVVIAIDAGTTGVRARSCRQSGAGRRPLLPGDHPVLPPPGLGGARRRTRSGTAVAATLAEVAGRLAERRAGRRRHRDHQPTRDGGGLGPADRAAAAPGHRLAGQPDGGRCDELVEAGAPAARPGADRPRPRSLLLGHQDGAGCSDDGGVGRLSELALGTVDAWVLWNLTGATTTGLFATDATNASRTLLYDIVDRRWSEELCEIFGVPLAQPARGAALVRPLRRGGRRRGRRRLPPGRACRSAGWPATSMPRCSARPASSRGWPRSPTGPGASCS